MEKNEKESQVIQVYCTHDWHVVTGISFLSWDRFMTYRGDNIEIDLEPLTRRVTHTLFCYKCDEIKRVNK